MAIIQLNGRITEDGLEVELPSKLPQGTDHHRASGRVEPAWTPEELDRALEVVPMTGAEIVNAGLTGGWANAGISGAEDWVRESKEAKDESAAA